MWVLPPLHYKYGTIPVKDPLEPNPCFLKTVILQGHYCQRKASVDIESMTHDGSKEFMMYMCGHQDSTVEAPASITADISTIMELATAVSRFREV